ncbi:MAG TPA: HypC/HybG/HupF family hydrogenase formation chaperone [Candidatus Obscuribacterales bacterium]
MCLAVPGIVEELYVKDGLPTAKVSFGGVRRSVCMTYTPEAQVGDYVIVHVGFAIGMIDEEEAANQLKILHLSGQLADELADGDNSNEIS